MELHALKNALYAPVQRLERNIKLLVIVPLPALLGLIAWGLFQWRRPSLSGAAVGVLLRAQRRAIKPCRAMRVS